MRRSHTHDWMRGPTAWVPMWANLDDAELIRNYNRLLACRTPRIFVLCCNAAKPSQEKSLRVQGLLRQLQMTFENGLNAQDAVSCGRHVIAESLLQGYMSSEAGMHTGQNSLFANLTTA